ncbi:MAG TPA: hypothetical protein DCR40_10310 [Prolixibacteraceae bacterium]|nr:hypothetical protein [Prolixibacteraceae bacterium]
MDAIQQLLKTIRAVSKSNPVTYMQLSEIIRALYRKSPAEALIQDGLISGGTVVWLYGLSYAVSQTVYAIGGEVFTSPSSIITLADADPTYSRIDVIVVNNTGEVEVITGEPSANPQKPSVNPATQIELTSVLLLANATEPEGITDEVIYDENIEWTPSTSGVTVNFNSTTLPFHGAKCADAGTIANNNTITFTNSVPLTVADYATLSLFLKLKAVASTKNAVYIRFQLAGVAISQEVAITWAIADTTNWQGSVIMLDDFTFTDTTFDSIRIRWSRVQGTTAHAGFYLDLIKLQTGVAPAVFFDTVQLTGDVIALGKTGTPIPSVLKNIITAGSFGDATHTLTLTVDAKGRITAITANSITIADGREVELSTSGGYIVWRYVGDPDWINLVALSSLVGPPGDDGAPGVQPIEVGSITLSSGSWSLVSGLYEYDLANANITANSIVDVIPDNADISIVKAADILPKTVSSAGSVKLYSTNAPTGNIGVTINITEAMP